MTKLENNAGEPGRIPSMLDGAWDDGYLPWGPFRGQLVSFKLVTNRMTDMMPEKGDVLEQRLSISPAGRLTVTDYALFDPRDFDNLKMVRKRVFKLSPDVLAEARRILADGFANGITMDPCAIICTDCGSWDASLVNERGEGYGYWNTLNFFEDSFWTELTVKLRKLLGYDDLWLFTNGREGEGEDC